LARSEDENYRIYRKSANYIYRAFFGKDKIREDKLKDRLKFYNDLNIDKYGKNYFSDNFSNTYFDSNNAKK